MSESLKPPTKGELGEIFEDRITTLTRERDEARAEVEREAALWEKEVDVWRQRIFEAHEILDKNKLAEHEHRLVDRLEVIIQDLHATQRALSNAHEHIEGLKQENERLRAALRLAEGPIAIAASYADQCETMGMRVHARDCARILPEIHAVLTGEKPPVRAFDRHGADRGRWVGVWDAINRYSEACGGSPSAISSARMDAVVEVERALDAVLAEEGEVGPASCTCGSLIPTCSTCDRCTCPPCALCDLGNDRMPCECFEPRCPRCMSGDASTGAEETPCAARDDQTHCSHWFDVEEDPAPEVPDMGPQVVDVPAPVHATKENDDCAEWCGACEVEAQERAEKARQA